MINNMLVPATKRERLYTRTPNCYSLVSRSGFIGYLRGDFGKCGNEFWTSFNEGDKSLSTQSFQKELDTVVNRLRGIDFAYLTGSNSTPLRSIWDMMQYCKANPEALMVDGVQQMYVFKLESASHVYIFRMLLDLGDDNLYIHCYNKERFEKWIEATSHGIRFITSDYKELFRIPDGGRIRVLSKDGETIGIYQCNFIDEYHIAVGPLPFNIFHICEFAEMMERVGNKVEPILPGLPEYCYSTLPSTGELIKIVRGEKGYYPCYDGASYSPETAREAAQKAAEERNDLLDVTKAQAAAMVAGSMFGWHVPAADPDNYDEDGKLIRR